MKTCGTANQVKLDDTVTINHRLGKVKLHNASTLNALYRVHLNEDFTMMVHTRTYGTAWTHCPQGMPEPIQSIVRDFLTSRRNHGHFFLYEDQIITLIQRHKE